MSESAMSDRALAADPSVREAADVRDMRPLTWILGEVRVSLDEICKAVKLFAHTHKAERDADIAAMMAQLTRPLNFEMAATDEMQAIALRHRPHAVCIVPEKRQERTTEGGLDVLRDEAHLRDFITPLREAGCRVSLFVEHRADQIEAAARIGAAVIELHTGTYAELCAAGNDAARDAELAALAEGARIADSLGLEVHAGHGLSFDNVGPIAALPQVVELNIGHFLIGEAIFVGLPAAMAEMRRRMDAARG